MDMGIKGKTALICGSSKGLGRGCAEALAAEGVNLVMNARTSSNLERTAEKIRKTYKVEVKTIACDVTTVDGQNKVFDTISDLDILVTNAGGPPPGMWYDWEQEDFLAALNANMLTPISFIKAYLPGMIAQGWGRIVNITSQSVKAPIATLGLSNAARTGLTGYVAGTARQVASKGVTINNLLPGVHDTDRIVSIDQSAVRAEGISMQQVKAKREAGIPVGRYGTRDEFGAACAFLCSQQAAFIVAQNILLDGGAINATI
jgi:3-oxoacyl-[acyl-carrier protein] reductase|tara:strand:+ start:128 stop:907 length:780 start_codon:yes stop_codon:yes gene_type:complete